MMLYKKYLLANRAILGIQLVNFMSPTNTVDGSYGKYSIIYKVLSQVVSRISINSMCVLGWFSKRRKRVQLPNSSFSALRT